MQIERPSKEALIRYYRGQSLPREEKLIDIYLSMDVDQDYVEACMQEAWNNLEDEPGAAASEQRQSTAWKKFQARKAGLTQFPAARKLKWYGYAASVALFLMGTFAIIHFRATRPDTPSFAHYTAELGRPTEVSLKDSSTVMLFPGSSLDVPSDFNNRDRKVTLKGRAFFEVAHNKQKPFLVRSGELTTTVLGTSFEVNSANANNISSITLRTGKVGISHAGKEVARLVPNQRISYNTRINQFKIEEVDAAYAMMWVEGELSYDLVPLTAICQDMERWYNVKITIKNPELLDKKITTSFKDLPVNKVLDMLSVTTGLTYTVKGNQITIN